MPTLPELIRRRWPELRGPGIVAVSGGADSVALLRALANWVEPVVVAHLNHRLRGRDSDADEVFTSELAQSLQLPFRSIAIDVAGEVRRLGANLESTARTLRYEWLAKVANENDAAWIATGHTADDQAETVLHRLLRGTGIVGLRGIARQRELLPGLRLIRPMLDAGRADVLNYLRLIGQSWREDQSNLDPAFTRNRIRHELLPLLRSFNPAIEKVLGRLAEQASEAHDDHQSRARELLAAAELPSAGGCRILRTSVLQPATPHQLREMFRSIWEREDWSRQDMDFDHWNRLVAVAHGELTAVDMPGGITARQRGNVMQLGKSK